MTHSIERQMDEVQRRLRIFCPPGYDDCITPLIERQTRVIRNRGYEPVCRMVVDDDNPGIDVEVFSASSLENGRHSIHGFLNYDD